MVGKLKRYSSERKSQFALAFLFLVLTLLVTLLMNVQKTEYKSAYTHITYPPLQLEFISTYDKLEIFRNYDIGREIEHSSRRYRLWESPTDIKKIDTTLLFDYDEDGISELVVLYWRYGDYAEDSEISGKL